MKAATRVLSNRRAGTRRLGVLLAFAAGPCAAQQARTPFSGGLLKPPAAQGQGGEEFVKPSRPGVADPAEPHRAGVLQMEFGYDGNFRAEEFRSEHTAPLTPRYAAADRLLLHANFDTFESQTERDGARQTGVGDVRLGFQVVALRDTERHPTLAFAYHVKLPAASEEKGLGTGRFDHRFVTLLSRKFGRPDVDFNAALLAVGREGAPGRVAGGQAALSVSHEFENDFGLQGELSGQTKDDVQPRGAYAPGALTYKASRRLVFDAGGLDADAPRAGFFAGFAVGVADFRE